MEVVEGEFAMRFSGEDDGNRAVMERYDAHFWIKNTIHEVHLELTRNPPPGWTVIVIDAEESWTTKMRMRILPMP